MNLVHLLYFLLDPTTNEETVKVEEWQYAMKEELIAIQRNKTWELTDLLSGKNAISLKWVFKTKFHVDGSI